MQQKSAKLIDKISNIFKRLDDSKSGKVEKEAQALKKVLKSLKKRKLTLTEKVEESASKAEKKKLKDQLKVVRAHRHKGLKALKELQSKKKK